eukprot:jgi/Botrbrau1/9177/Bobra.0236s0009.1
MLLPHPSPCLHLTPRVALVPHPRGRTLWGAGGCVARGHEATAHFNNKPEHNNLQAYVLTLMGLHPFVLKAEYVQSVSQGLVCPNMLICRSPDLPFCAIVVLPVANL